MLFRDETSTGSTDRRPRLDAAIIASVLAMGALNVLVIADQIGPSRAYAAAPCRCGTIAGVALA